MFAATLPPTRVTGQKPAGGPTADVNSLTAAIQEIRARVASPLKGDGSNEATAFLSAANTALANKEPLDLPAFGTVWVVRNKRSGAWTVA